MTNGPKVRSPGAEEDPEALVRTHQTQVWRYLRLLGANPADAEDLLQETFLRLLRRGVPAGPVGPLLRTIARGLWIDRHRWLRRWRAVQWADELDASLSREGEAEQETWLEALRACREGLGERARRAIELTYRDGLSRQEVAAALAQSPNTVRNLLARTRDVLRECIHRRITKERGEER